MVGDLFYKVGGKTHFGFCLDASGNLLRLSADGRPDTLIPYAVSVESTALDLIHPKPWTITVAKVLERFRLLPSSLIAGTDLESVLRSKTIPQAQYPYVPLSQFSDSDEQIEKAIEMWEALADGDPLKAKIEAAMLASGLSRIPRLATYFERVHIKTKPSEDFAVISDGWMSCSKVYRKSVVRGG